VVDMGDQRGCRKVVYLVYLDKIGGDGEVVYLVYPVYLSPGDATGDTMVTQEVTLGQREFPGFSLPCKG